MTAIRFRANVRECRYCPVLWTISAVGYLAMSYMATYQHQLVIAVACFIMGCFCEKVRRV